MLRGGKLFPLVIWFGAWCLRFLHTTIERNFPKVHRTINSTQPIVLSPPVLISIAVPFALHPATHALVLDYIEYLLLNRWWATFLWLFWWKAVKIIVHTYSYVFLTAANLYRPAIHPLFNSKDATVICPTVGNFGPEFNKTILSILANSPRRISKFIFPFQFQCLQDFNDRSFSPSLESKIIPMSKHHAHFHPFPPLIKANPNNHSCLHFWAIQTSNRAGSLQGTREGSWCGRRNNNRHRHRTPG